MVKRVVKPVANRNVFVAGDHDGAGVDRERGAVVRHSLRGPDCALRPLVLISGFWMY